MLIDVDGVVADFIGLYLNMANATLGRTFTRADAEDGWRVDKSLGLTKKEKNKVESQLSEPGKALELEVLPGAVDAIRELSRMVDLYFVTSPWYSSQTWMHDRSRWLEKVFGPIGKQVVHTRHKHICIGDYLVDDKAENVNKWSASNSDGERMPILWMQPWNRTAELDKACFSVSGWGELIGIVMVRQRT